MNKYYFKLGQHYAGLKEYKVSTWSTEPHYHNIFAQMAEKFYLSGNLYKHAIEMYNTAGLWEQVKVFLLFFFLIILEFFADRISVIMCIKVCDT